MVRSFGLAFESTGFRSQLRVDTVLPHWWVLIERNRSVCGWLLWYIYIYIYIYIYMCVCVCVCVCVCKSHNFIIEESSWWRAKHAGLQHCYKWVWIPVWIDTLGKGINSYISTSYGFDSTITVLLQGRFWD